MQQLLAANRDSIPWEENLKTPSIHCPVYGRRSVTAFLVYRMPIRMPMQADSSFVLLRQLKYKALQQQLPGPTYILLDKNSQD